MSLPISHYSDLLCVWAYVTQPRVDQLQDTFGDAIDLGFHYVPVYGAALDKVDEHWGRKGGLAGYNRFVTGLVDELTDLPVHEGVWVENTPASSAPGHQWLCAARLAEADDALPAGATAKLAWALRKAFFAEARNIADHGVITEVTETAGVAVAPLLERMRDGRAQAAFSADLAETRAMNIRISPTMTLNEDRQRLTGNVSYDVLEANIRAML
ncbi:disulfide bond formation protein DsbA [Marinihelvus fidelis]|uniref:Disulfide bond formation protein DsbA n=1 Tax=Marinihelvus fidelis TaxID=2613842 RepID=A0A5N0T5U7_9GAMM|nr:DsbA family protein [Marinihelvus fidelis]KAA9130191.1 disulfide bond formation protein DsbA [Marinihelvus fidelis]